MSVLFGNELSLVASVSDISEGDIIVVFNGNYTSDIPIRRMGIFKNNDIVYERNPTPTIIEGISYHTKKVSYDNFNEGYPVYKILTTREKQCHEYFTLPNYVLNEYISVPKYRRDNPTIGYQKITCLHPRMVLFRAEQGCKDTSPYVAGLSSCDTFAFECKTDNDVKPLLWEHTSEKRDPSTISQSNYCIIM